MSEKAKKDLLITVNREQEKKPEAVKFEFGDLGQAEEYLEWKKTVPVEFRRIVEGVVKNGKSLEVITGKPLTDSFLNKIGESLEGRRLTDLVGCDKTVANILSFLEKVETQGGFLNIFETLASPVTSWDLKNKIYETQIKPALDWLIARDLQEMARKEVEKKDTREGEKNKEKTESAEEDNSKLPPEQDEAVSSMEAGKPPGEQEQKEGEPARPLFLVKPFFGGYASDKEFDELGGDFRWRNVAKAAFAGSFGEPRAIFEAGIEEYELAKARLISGKVRGGQLLALPVFDNWTVDPSFIETNAPEGTTKIFQDKRGKFYLKIDAEGVFHYAIRIAPRLSQRKEEKAEEINIGGELPEELKKEIKKLKDSRFPKMKLKREIAKLIRNHLTYSNSREAWEYYIADSGRDFFKRVWQRKEADCFVSNTFAARALAEIDKDTLLVSGFFIKEKDVNGNAIMHKGNGHGWIKVWDDLSERYVRLDATPKGDPNVDEEQQENELEGKDTDGEGDFGEEDEMASEDETKKQIKKMKQEKEGSGGSGKSKKEFNLDLESQKFAEEAGCSERQAEEFLNVLERVRKIKDDNNNSVSDLIKEEWRKVIQERIVKSSQYKGPVRMDEGDRLESPVDAMIDIKAGEFNPTGFERERVTEIRKYDFGGLNLFFSFDLSGSMREPDSVSGRAKADVQRDAALLLVDGLMQCAFMNRQNIEDSELLPLKIMATLASSTGQLSLPLTDKWGSKEQWAFYSALIRLASGGTPTHETLNIIEKSLVKETAELKIKKIPKEKMPANYVAVFTDGEPNDFSASEQAADQLTAAGAQVRQYTIGATSTSKYASEPLASFSDLPRIVSRDIVELMKNIKNHN